MKSKTSERVGHRRRKTQREGDRIRQRVIKTDRDGNERHVR